MKKVLYILLLMVFATGCTKDPNSGNSNNSDSEGISLNETEISLYKDDEYTIQAISETPLIYTSDNEYHATVSNNGLVKARYVGTTTINISNSSEVKHLKVNVIPRHEGFSVPNISFGDNRETVIGIMGEPDYIQFNGKVYGYYFDGYCPEYLEVRFEEDMVSEFELVFMLTYEDEAKGYVSERYKYQYTHLTTDYYINALETIDATMLVGSYKMNARYWGLVFKPYNR